MSRNRRFKDAKSKRDGTTFIPVPVAVLESAAYRGLPMRAKALLLDMLQQYRGINNGDISAAFSNMKAFGWKSEATLFAARRELEEAGLVFVTRMGARPNRPTLFGFTFYELDEMSKLEVTRKSFPRGQWRMKDPIPPLVKGLCGASVTSNAAVAQLK